MPNFYSARNVKQNYSYAVQGIGTRRRLDTASSSTVYFKIRFFKNRK
jgi:hypothetical protein